MQAFETLTVETIGPVASVTLNRPAERNAMSARMVEELLRCFVALRDDPVHNDVRVVVLRAAGEVFCAGGDLRDLASGAAPNAERVAVGRLDELLQTVNEGPQVVVARVHPERTGGARWRPGLDLRLGHRDRGRACFARSSRSSARLGARDHCAVRHRTCRLDAGATTHAHG